jgi:ubiquitin thioesterase OTU1
MPDDNSCLFHALKHTMKIDLSISSLRRIIYNTITGNPIQYTDAVLGKSRREYAVSMLESGWGGGIEIAILSKYFGHEVAVVDVHEKRVYVLYTGIHYDALQLDDGTTKFSAGDVVAERCVKEIASNLRANRQYTNTSTATLVCEKCGNRFRGSSEAQHHAEMFGHTEFKEV